MSDKPHTDQQRKALHLWLRQCAQVCRDNGFTFTHFMREVADTGIEIPVTPELMKEMYRVGYQATTGKQSTSKANTTDYDPAYHALVLFFGERGIRLPPWPDRYTQSIEQGNIGNSPREDGS